MLRNDVYVLKMPPFITTSGYFAPKDLTVLAKSYEGKLSNAGFKQSECL